MKTQVSTPDTVASFTCTMNDCEDNCCRNGSWKIIIDPPTYEKYLNMENEFKETLLSRIEKTPKGILQFKEYDHGQCPLLTDDGFCSIHRNLGPSYLCITCATYPRNWAFYNGKADYWVSLSCPVVVRDALYQNKKIRLMNIVAEQTTKIPLNKPREADEYRMREMLYSIIDHNKFSLMDKIIYKSLFMRAVEKLPKDDSFAFNINTTINAYKANLYVDGLLDELKEGLSQIDMDGRKISLQIIARLAATAISKTKSIPQDMINAPYYKLMEQFGADCASGDVDSYLVDAFDRLVIPYVNANPLVFDNYFIYILHSTQFAKGAESYSNCYSGYIGEFVAMLVFAAGLFHEKEQLTDEEMIVAIYMYHRKVSHSPQYRGLLAKHFEDNNLGFLFGMCEGIK